MTFDELADSHRHISSFDEDEDGWPFVRCSCGWAFGPLPDMETAADAWGDHQYTIGRTEAIEGGVTAIEESDSDRPTDPAELGRHTPPSPGQPERQPIGAVTATPEPTAAAIDNWLTEHHWRLDPQARWLINDVLAARAALVAETGKDDTDG